MSNNSESFIDREKLEAVIKKLETLSKKVDEIASVVMEGDVNDTSFHERLEKKIGKKKNEQ